MEPVFDHAKLDVYKVSLEYAGWVSNLANGFKGDTRNIKDQIIRSSQPVPLNIAEGNGKRSPADRKRFLEVARGSAVEGAATLDVLVAIGACERAEVAKGKALLVRVVSMLTKMTEREDGTAREDESDYGMEL